MSSLTLVAVAHALLLAGGENNYADARKLTNETGKPMVVLVGAKWCPACETMKKEVMPKVVRKGLFGRCVYTVVDVDREEKLGRALTSGGPIPQLLMFRKTRRGWLRRRLIGGQSVDKVVRFIDEGIKADEKEKKDTTEAGKSPSEDRQAAASGPAGLRAS